MNAAQMLIDRFLAVENQIAHWANHFVRVPGMFVLCHIFARRSFIVAEIALKYFEYYNFLKVFIKFESLPQRFDQLYET